MKKEIQIKKLCCLSRPTIISLMLLYHVIISISSILSPFSLNILLVFAYLLQTYYYIYFFHILSLYSFLLQIILYVYFLLFLLILLCYFHNNLLLCLKLLLCFFGNKLFHSFSIYNKRL